MLPGAFQGKQEPSKVTRRCPRLAEVFQGLESMVRRCCKMSTAGAIKKVGSTN
jgi:hypothetical protein